MPAFPPVKTSVVLFAVLAASLAFVPAASAANDPNSQPAAATTEKAQPGVMQVTVNVPASMRPWISDDIAEAFAGRVTDVLHQRGYKSKVHYVNRSEEPAADQPLLAINLIEWRTDHVGNVDCTFSAALSTPQGKKDLGLFIGTSMMMFSRPDWFARSDQFDDAARQALHDLYQRITETHLLSS
jgi:hypothetical protein